MDFGSLATYHRGLGGPLVRRRRWVLGKGNAARPTASRIAKRLTGADVTVLVIRKWLGARPAAERRFVIPARNEETAGVRGERDASVRRGGFSRRPWPGAS